MEIERHCFKCDEDGHWYLIKVEEKKRFDKLLYDEDDEYEQFEEAFGNNRLDMHISNYSFIDCKRID